MAAARVRRADGGRGPGTRRVQRIRLGAAIDQASTSRGTTVVIAGDVGAGKSRLATETSEAAQARGFRVLTGTAAQMHEDVTFAVFLHLLGPALAAADAAERRRLTGGLPDLARLFVELPGDRLPPIADPGLERLRLLESVLVLVRRLSVAQPLVMVLDDVQWADRASVDLLMHLTRGISAEPVLLIVCVRTDDGRHPEHLSEMLDHARRSGTVDEIVLPALEPDEVSRICTAVLDGPAPAELLDALTAAGVDTPLFVREVLTTSIGNGALAQRGGHWVVVGEIPTGSSRTIDELMAGRLRTLSESARTALNWVVVAGESAVAVAGHLAEQHLQADWAELTDLGWLTAGDRTGPLRVSHPLLAEVCYRSIPPGVRRRMHREVARALLDGAVTGPDTDRAVPGDRLGLIAHHVRLAGHEWPAGSALDWMTAAATLADRVSAQQSSLEMWSGAEQLARRLRPSKLPEILEHLGRARSRVGQIPAALTSWHEAVRLRAVAGDGVAEARLRGEMSMVVCDQGDPAQARSMLDAASEALQRSRRRADGVVTAAAVDAEATLRAEATLWGLRVWIAGRHDSLPQLVTLSTALEGFCARHPGSGAEPSLYLLRYDIACREGDLLAAEDHARQALSSATEAGDTVAAGHARRQLFVSALGRGDLATADRVALPRSAGRPDDRREFVASPLTSGALRAFVTDDWVSADRSARSTIEFGLRIGSPRVVVPIMGYLAVIAVQQGRVPDAESLLAEATETLGSGAGRDQHVVGVMYQARALVDLAQGRAAAAVAAAQQAAAIRGLLPAMTFVAWVQGLLDLGDVDRAREVARDLASIGPGPWPTAVSSWLSGRVALVDGEPQRAVALLTASRQELEGLHMPYQAARSGLDEARALAAVGRPEDAATRALASASVFATYQARPLADETRQFLSTLGHRIGNGRTRGPASSLSEREWDVVGLVAQGLSNAEVGRRLFISPRTVTTHLQHVYSKTGVTSRTALVRWAVDAAQPSTP
ncbi:helix-turn-helix transcriptional regulator [Nakamurella deserti]|uniref:helix-turn-helix transcriptional regulator n=1 Tax=Nakamurella deserti TaxID=2164074 RepID=UPI0014792F61|nr:AAA family ATPase [Nakamurella deserti]